MPLETEVTRTDLNLQTIVLFVRDMGASCSFYEHTLGLRALEVNPHAATYSAGHIQLRLLPAAERGVTLQDGPDRSVDITFMVPDFPRSREVLTAQGVHFSPTLEYSIGMTADFYDPDGHWFSLYQPSEAAMGWPSGPKLQALASGLPMRLFEPESPVGAAVPGDAAAQANDLADAFIAYVFLFFSDPDVAEGFYGGVLGLEAIEGGPCRRIVTRAPIGVVKYDVGATLLTTHHVELDDKRFRVATVGTAGIALEFQVAHLTTAVAALSRRGVMFSGLPSESPSGPGAWFTDPAGHVLLLREPKQEGEGSVRSGILAHAVAAN